MLISVNKQSKVLLMMLFVAFLLLPSYVSAENKEIELYALDDIYENISIPDNLTQEYQFPEGSDASYVVEGESVSVSSDGLVKPVSEIWYLYDTYRTTTKPKATDAEQPYATVVYHNFGTSTVKVVTKTGKYLVEFHVNDYSDNYMNQVLDDYIDQNIKEGMTQYEKLDKIVAFPAQYIYDRKYSSCKGMVIFGGGDCWASTDAIIKLCEKVGLPAHIRYGANDSDTAGSGHKNAAVLIDGEIYVGEAGYIGSTAPRAYDIRKENTGFFVKSNSNGTGRLMQYDGYEDTVNIPETVDGITVNTIGEYALSSYHTWKQFTSVVFPETITTIEDYAFYKADKVEEINITKNVCSIGEVVFCGCENLKRISVDSNNSSYADDDGVLYNKDKTKLLYYPGGGNEYYTVCDTATEIANWAFCETNTLKTVFIPAGVNKIGDEAFRLCNVKKIYFCGDKPEFGNDILRYTYDVEVYYPANNSTWDDIENDASFSDATLIKWNPENSLTECQKHGHEYTYGKVIDGKISAICNKCNEKTSFSVPVEFAPMWNNEITSQYDNTFSSNLPEINPVGSDLRLMIHTDNKDTDFNKFVIEASDDTVISIPGEVDADKEVRLEIKKAGVVKLTIYPKYNPDKKYEEEIAVGGKGDLDISKAQVEFDEQGLQRGVAKPNLTVVYDDIVLKRNMDYSVEYGKTECAVTVKITGLNVFENSVLNATAPATIFISDNRVSIAAANISINNGIYTGKAVNPSPKVQFNGKNLEAGKDYTVSYKNNINPGKATVLIKGKGNYKGSARKTFLITLNKTKIKKVKSGKKEITVSWNKAKNISGYEIQYSRSSKFSNSKKVLKSRSSKKVKIRKLTSKKSYYVRIRTYKTISGKKYYSDWSSKKKVKVK